MHRISALGSWRRRIRSLISFLATYQSEASLGYIRQSQKQKHQKNSSCDVFVWMLELASRLCLFFHLVVVERLLEACENYLEGHISLFRIRILSIGFYT